MNDTLISPGSDVPRNGPSLGVFDSGVGGLSILRALRERLPDTSMLYFGDVAHAPYGDRSAQHVHERCALIVEWLATMGATQIVVACNTATVLAIEALRARWPEIVFVGVEPGVKPAAAHSRNRRIAVMVTAATASSARLQLLIDRHAQGTHVHVEPCPGLVDAIERGELGGEDVLGILVRHCNAIRAAKVDTVVLGCTHYPFVAGAIRKLLGIDVNVIDTATAIAKRSASLWKQCGPAVDPLPAVRVFSSGAAGPMQQLLNGCRGLDHVRVEVLTMMPSNPPG